MSATPKPLQLEIHVSGHGQCVVLDQLATALGVSRQAIWSWRTRQGLPTLRACGLRLIPLAEFMTWVESESDERAWIKTAVANARQRGDLP